jgi:hypothetical protein
MLLSIVTRTPQNLENIPAHYPDLKKPTPQCILIL